MTHAPALPATIALTINGERRELPAPTTLATLLERLDLDPRLVVVERNRAIVRNRDAYGAIDLVDGDVLELVHFVGGG